MNVLHLFKVFLPDVHGGIPRVIDQITHGLAGSTQSTILVCSKTPKKFDERSPNVIVRATRSLFEVMSMPIAPLYPLHVWRLASSANVVAIHSPFPVADLAVALFVSPAKRVVVHWHAEILAKGVLGKVMKPLQYLTLRRASQIVVSDASLITSSSLLRRFRKKCVVVPFGIKIATDREPFAAEPTAAKDLVSQIRAAQPRLVIACGRLVSYKGFDILIKAVADIDCTLWIVGEGRERASLAALIESLKLGDRVRLLGAIPDAERDACFRAARVFAFPSRTAQETFGIAQLEAMAVGCPVVNTALNTAVPKIARDGCEGFTVPPDDVGALAAAIETILDDSDLASRFAASGQRRARELYSEENFLNKISAAYRVTPQTADVDLRALSSGAGAPTSSGGTAPFVLARLAFLLAWYDIKARYYRSVIGPFWNTIQTAVFTTIIGFAAKQLIQADYQASLPAISLGLVLWTFLSGCIIDSTNAIAGAGNLIKDRAINPLVVALQCFFRHFFFLLHNAIVPLLIMLAFHLPSPREFLLATPGLALVFVNVLLGAVCFATAGARFRDVRPITESILQLAFLVTPIVWMPVSQAVRPAILELNPLFHLFSLWRTPLMGGAYPYGDFAVALSVTAILALTAIASARLQRQAAFWV